MAASSQASTLVNRGRTAGEAVPKAPSGAAQARAKRISARTNTKGFYYEEGSALQLAPTTVIGSAVLFIVAVFILHIIGKIRG